MKVAIIRRADTRPNTFHLPPGETHTLEGATRARISRFVSSRLLKVV